MSELFGFALGLIIVILIFCIILSIISYVICGLFQYQVANEYNIENKWMAWVPLFNTYYFGKIIGDIYKDRSFTNKFTYSFFGYIVFMILTEITNSSLVAFIAIIFSIVFIVYYIIGLNKIYKIYIPENATVATVFSIFTIVQLCIMLYLIITKVNKNKLDTQKEPMN